MFYAVGHTPNTQFLDGTGGERAESGYIFTQTDEAGRPTARTAVDGVFAAGDVADERDAGRDLGAEHGVDVETDMGPIQVVGSGATVNDATQNAFDRASKLLDMSEGEVRARCTFTGGVQIGRLPGVVQLDMLVPMDLLEDRGLDGAVREQYGL